MAPEASSTRQARLLRFREEAKKGPPPIPLHRSAWPGGKIVTNSKEQCLKKLLERKLNSGARLTAEQDRALRALQPSSASEANVTRHPPRSHPVLAKVGGHQDKGGVQVRTELSEAHDQQEVASATSSLSQERRKLLKKIRQIEELELAQASGKVLEDNQLAKIKRKASLLAELEACE